MKYRDAGVDSEGKARWLKEVAARLQATYTPQVLKGVGAFAGLFSAEALRALSEPVLVATTDGVGTKVLLALQLGAPEGLGRDLVHHCVNDILVQGARPLFFLDYLASAQLDPEILSTLLSSLADACQGEGIPLLAGETAEMPGVYREGAWDLVGTLVGVVERGEIVDGQRVQPGDALLALPSSGLHTNGYSLVRQLFSLEELKVSRHELGGQSLAQALLVPHRSYRAPVELLKRAGLEIRAMAHITGGGVAENLPRVLPPGLGALLWRESWKVPPLFELIAAAGVEEEEMFRVFNMGLGYLLVMPREAIEQAQQVLGEGFWVGEIVPEEGVRWR